MMEVPSKVNEIKAVIAVILSAISALLGWQGVLVLIWVGAMVLDYITGSAAAMQAGEWSSKVARAGLRHKGGSIAIALVAAMMDIAMQQIATEAAGFNLPWSKPIIFPVVILWFILTEFGSIVENSIKCGAPCPAWLPKIFASVKAWIDKKQEQQSGQPPDTGRETEHSASEDLDSENK